MEGLIGVSYDHRGPLLWVSLELRNPPGTAIEAMEYAMLNQLDFPVDGISGIGRIKLIRIVNLDVRNELQEWVYGQPGAGPSIRYVRVRGFVVE